MCSGWRNVHWSMPTGYLGKKVALQQCLDWMVYTRPAVNAGCLVVALKHHQADRSIATQHECSLASHSSKAKRSEKSTGHATCIARRSTRCIHIVMEICLRSLLQNVASLVAMQRMQPCKALWRHSVPLQCQQPRVDMLPVRRV